MQWNLPLGITINFGKNGKYVKKYDCDLLHKNFNEYLDRKFTEVALDRNQKLIELKQDLMAHIDIKFDILRK